MLEREYQLIFKIRLYIDGNNKKYVNRAEEEFLKTNRSF